MNKLSLNQLQVLSLRLWIYDQSLSRFVEKHPYHFHCNSKPKVILKPHFPHDELCHSNWRGEWDLFERSLNKSRDSSKDSRCGLNYSSLLIKSKRSSFHHGQSSPAVDLRGGEEIKLLSQNIRFCPFQTKSSVLSPNSHQGW